MVVGSVCTLLVGLSRMYLGVHYPSDVVAAWAVGVLWTTAAFQILFRRHPLNQLEKRRAAERH
ncbi:hypothetical protein GCM10017781_44590 [Deinococcus metalli]|uniref:Phosphatidic acid phosphatase type 2/haloperoxidase domain-containing protein n=1 Tax=Deinococcus metalli TaxID=1141878 RepID=A0ABQ3JV43_9DEIO|nr:hypothetical protein GCM10017781_44590 [Deinococcus metalli]